MNAFYTKREPLIEYGEQGKFIAEGTYGYVYETTKGYAIKITESSTEEGEVVSFLREVCTLRSISHPNIINLLALYNVEDQRIIYMERATRTLTDYIESANKTAELTRSYLYQLLQALAYCHHNYIIHRDVKPDNILLFGDQLQLADFGLSRTFITSGEIYTDEVVTLWWRAPELLLGKTNYSYEIDIWSAGIIMMIILTGENLFKGSDEDHQLRKIFKVLGTPNENDWPGVTNLRGWDSALETSVPQEPRTIEELDADLLYKLLAWPPRRITAAEAITHAYFETVTEKYSEYSTKVFKYPSKTFFNEEWRFILFDWLWTVKDNYRLRYNTLFMAYYIFDKYLEHNPYMQRIHIQGYGIAALLIASKMQEIKIIPIDDFVCLSADTVSAEELLRMEADILIALDYKILHHPYNHIFKNSAYPQNSVKYNLQMMNHLVAIYLNYDWITSWTAEECLSILEQYLNGEEPQLYSREELEDYFSHLGGGIGKKLLFRKK